MSNAEKSDPWSRSRFGDVLGTKGYTKPDVSGLREYVIGAESVPNLKELGISVEGPFGKGNRLFIGIDVPKCDFTLRFRGFSGNEVVIGKGDSVSGHLNVAGDNNIFVAAGFGKMGSVTNVRFTLGGRSNHVYLGEGFTSVSSDWIIEGDNRTVIVGNDCMVSWNVYVMNYDSHGIIDVASRAVINAPADILIGQHCWIGRASSIVKGVTIGSGSIIGGGSTVTTDIASQVIVVGSPAREVRSGVTWSRGRNPTQQHIDRLIDEVMN